MEIVTYTDPKAFAGDAHPLYLAHEARYCVPLGVSTDLISHPTKWKKFHLACLMKNGQATAALLMTPPHPLSLTDVMPEDIPQIVDYASALEDKPNSVVAEDRVADQFQQYWCLRTRAKVHDLKRQGIFQLERVALQPGAPGAMIIAKKEHYDLQLKWQRAFISDCNMRQETDSARERALLEFTIASQSRYLWVANGEPVAMAGSVGKTPNGIRVSYVYTPPEQRGKGYATALVTRLTEKLLANGNKFCFLFTDLANPTSNSIYQKIGYQRIGTCHHYRFGE